MREMNPVDLKAHPLNFKLYGSEKPDPELVESIKIHGVLELCKVLNDGTIISGHRRWKAALACDPVPKIPCEVVTYPNTFSEEEAVIEHNRQRIKTFMQLMNECEQLERIYKVQAKENSINNLRNYRRKLMEEKGKSKNPSNKMDSKGFDQLTNAIPADDKPSQVVYIGRVRDIVAKHANMSGRTYANGKKVIEALASEDPEIRKIAEEEIEKLNNNETSIHAAHQRIRGPSNAGRKLGSTVEGIAIASVKKLVQISLDDFTETKVRQVGNDAVEFLKIQTETYVKGITIRAAKSAESAGRKTIKEEDIRRALKIPIK